MNDKTYLEEVDNTLKKLRDRCLGFQNKYEILLPAGGKNWKPERRARHLSGMLLFALVKSSSSGLEAASLQKIADWLYYLVLYLETNCNPEDRTFSAVHVLVDVGADMRLHIFREEPFRVLADMPAELVLSDLDLAMWSLVKNKNAGECAVSLYKRIRAGCYF